MQTQRLTLHCLWGTGTPRFAFNLHTELLPSDPKKEAAPSLCDLLCSGAAEPTPMERSPGGKQRSEGNRQILPSFRMTALNQDPNEA